MSNKINKKNNVKKANLNNNNDKTINKFESFKNY